MDPRLARLRALIAAAALLVVGTAIAPEHATGWPNGQAPASALSRINTGFGCDGPGDQLSNRAAAGWNTMALAARKPLPTNGCDSAYRSFTRQVFWRNHWCSLGLCGNAAIPGTSNHGWGLAVDVPQWVRAHIDQRGRAFGWCKCWSDAAHEWWHVKFNPAAFDRPDPGLNLKKPRLRVGSGGPGQHHWVKKAQKRLRKHGAKGLRPDGEFGPKTARRVKAFERAEKFKDPDGQITKRTWKRLLKPVVKPQPAPPPLPVPTGPVSGVDVSQHQGSIDFRAVARQHEFAITKATEGEDFRDPTFSEQRLDAIRKAGMLAGVYHFVRPRADRPGSREATWFAHNVQKAGFGRGDLRPVIDIESTTLTASGTCAYLRSFVDRTRAQLEVKPIIYTYVSFANTYLVHCGRWLSDLPLWVAHYNGAPGRPTVPAPWKGHVIHQWTSTGSSAGVAGNVDLNVVNGGRQVLDDLRIGVRRRQAKRSAVTAVSHKGYADEPVADALVAKVDPPEHPQLLPGVGARGAE